MEAEKFIEKGIRLSVKAEEILRKLNNSDVEKEIIDSGKKYIDEEEVKKLIEKKKEEQIVVKRPYSFKPLSKEYSSNIKVLDRDVTGNSRTTGSIDDFVEYFRNRYSKLSKMLKKFDPKYPETKVEDLKKSMNQQVKIIVMVTDIRETKNKNILLEGEDLTGICKIVISQGKEKLFELGRRIIKDDVIAIRGKVLEAFVIAEDIEWPDLPITREKKLSENDLAAAYLSDIHFGSNNFLEESLERFISWIKGENGAESLASKVKYILIAGDIVDGIGIYPNQEKELIVSDIYKQYEIFNDFVERLPEYIEVIAIPGNHDAVRRGEPSPALESDLISCDITSLGNPSTVVLEGIKHVLYHGTSMDSLISSLYYLSYKKPEVVMEEYLKRRHFSTLYGGNLIVPEKKDYLVLEEEPDVLHMGHIHKNGYGYYRGTVMINSGTFQARTEFQVRQGHVPTPGIVPVYEFKTGRLKTLNFLKGEQ
ncbi:MAG: DNA-directed DNA polymerase II small subunit [Candidatus ainarchaeum sp.]|nr:DNA-directed DNA polymerase II small subunit [Candidatus ainarchaeum sp.]